MALAAIAICWGLFFSASATRPSLNDRPEAHHSVKKALGGRHRERRRHKAHSKHRHRLAEEATEKAITRRKQEAGEPHASTLSKKPEHHRSHKHGHQHKHSAHPLHGAGMQAASHLLLRSMVALAGCVLIGRGVFMWSSVAWTSWKKWASTLDQVFLALCLPCIRRAGRAPR
ncbi:unnamed protein product [Effrenium voratum]|nr:unnamed protein product [Effrenium voratum]